MQAAMRTPILISVLLILAACGGSDSREAGGVSPAEAEALDQAAEMLEAERLPVEAIPPAQPPATAPAPVKPAG
jgi:hypothetical protein